MPALTSTRPHPCWHPCPRCAQVHAENEAWRLRKRVADLAEVAGAKAAATASKAAEEAKTKKEVDAAVKEGDTAMKEGQAAQEREAAVKEGETAVKEGETAVKEEETAEVAAVKEATPIPEVGRCPAWCLPA